DGLPHAFYPFPYTTLFRSPRILEHRLGGRLVLRPPQREEQEADDAHRDERGAVRELARPERRDRVRVERVDEERRARRDGEGERSEEHTSELQSRENLVCR